MIDTQTCPSPTRGGDCVAARIATRTGAVLASVTAMREVVIAILAGALIAIMAVALLVHFLP
jgi:hypothetical protein